MTAPPRPCLMLRGDPAWPSALEHLHDVPAAIWTAGSVAALGAPAVAIVGSRQGTVVGLEVARSLAAGLASRGVTVISGLALGVDAAAHRGALDVGGATVAILACGVDVCYPQRHQPLRDQILARSGLVLSEEVPGAPPAAWRFPRRNRIIAALAAAVVIVEAAERSGALITARHAADLGREVLAVPGSIRSDRSIGTNRLIRDGATPVLEIDDILDSVPAFRHLPRGAPPRGAPPPPSRDTLDADLAAILSRCGPDPIHPDDLRASLGLPAPVVAARLTALEMAGRVITVDGGMVQLVPRGPS